MRCLDALEKWTNGECNGNDHRNEGRPGRNHGLEWDNKYIEGTENEHRHDNIKRKVKIDITPFNGTYDTQFLCDWLVDMDNLFDWNGMLEAWKIHFAKVKLQGSTKA